MKIISHSELCTNVEFQLFFQRKGETKGTGLGFSCSKDGVIDEATLHLAARENLIIARQNVEYAYPIILDLSHTYREPAVGECPCGEHVMLDRFTNTCECGRDFNMSGQELAPREQWGEETGEHWTECY